MTFTKLYYHPPHSQSAAIVTLIELFLPNEIILGKELITNMVVISSTISIPSTTYNSDVQRNNHTWTLLLINQNTC